jgi:DNA gyrase subunit A
LRTAWANFGSRDSDPPADALYTEARLAPLARELPRFPNLLVNGSPTMPPHNLREAAAVVCARLDDPGADVAGMLAPVYPTGGVIVDAAPLRQIYETGAGELRLRARAHVEHGIVAVTELPYGVDKGGEDGVIVELVELTMRHRVIEDIQDRSEGEMRVVIVPRQGTSPQALLNRLYADTRLEVVLLVEFVAQVDSGVRRMSLGELIDRFLAGRDPEAVRRELQDVADRFGDDRRTSLGAR